MIDRSATAVFTDQSMSILLTQRNGGVALVILARLKATGMVVLREFPEVTRRASTKLCPRIWHQHVRNWIFDLDPKGHIVISVDFDAAMSEESFCVASEFWVRRIQHDSIVVARCRCNQRICGQRVSVEDTLYAQNVTQRVHVLCELPEAVIATLQHDHVPVAAPAFISVARRTCFAARVVVRRRGVLVAHVSLAQT
jgi:hypothetical protein